MINLTFRRSGLFLIFLFVYPVYAATFTVNNNFDSGVGSLRQAILDSNAAGGDNNIVWSGTGGQINLLSELPSITNNLAIDAGGASSFVNLQGLTTLSVGVGQSASITSLGLGNNTITKSGDGLLTLLWGVQVSGDINVTAGSVQARQNIPAGNISNSGTFVFYGDYYPEPYTYSGTISGSGSVVRDNGNPSIRVARDFILSGNNTYTGGTIVRDGLSIYSDANLGAASGRLTIDGGYIEFLNNVVSQRAISASGDYPTIDTQEHNVELLGPVDGWFSKTGSGTLSLGGSNSISSLSIQAGTVKAESTSALVNSNVTLSPFNTAPVLDLNGYSQHLSSLNGGGEVRLNQATLTLDSGSYDGKITGEGNLIKDGSGTLSLTGLNTYHGTTQIDAGEIQTAAASIPGDVEDNGVLQFREDSDATFTRNISGTGSVVVSGRGSLALRGLNSFSGGLVVDGGTLALDQNTNFENVLGGITLKSGAKIKTLDGIDFAKDLTSESGTIDTNGFDSVLSGNISGAFLGKIGTGVLTLSGANALARVQLTDGTLRLGSDNALSNQTDMEMSEGTVLDLNGHNTTIGNFTWAPEGSSVHLGGGSLTANAGILSGAISGSGDLVKDGVDTLTINGTNSYSGNTIIREGTLNATLNSLPGDIHNDGLLLIDSGAGGELKNSISGSGRLRLYGSGIVSMTGHNTYTGGTTIGTTIAIDADQQLGDLSGDLTFTNGSLLCRSAMSISRPIVISQYYSGTIDTHGNDVTLSGLMSGSGSLEKRGKGTLLLDGQSQFTGDLIISGGILKPGAKNVFGNSRIIFSSDNDAPVLNLNGFSQTVGGIEGNGTVQLGSADLTVNPISYSYLSASITGSGSVIKEGAGDLHLTGQNSFTGGTTINNGTLYGSLTSLPGDIKDNGGLTLEGEGGAYSGHLSGDGRLNIDTSIELTSENAFSGDVNVSGALRLGDKALDHMNNLSVIGVLDLQGYAAHAKTVTNFGSINLRNGSLTTDLYSGAGYLATAIRSHDSYGRLHVSGDADISNGTLFISTLAGYTPMNSRETFRILEAGKVIGQFANVFQPAAITFNVLYGSTFVDLSIDQVPFGEWALTGNQAGVAGALDRIRNDNPERMSDVLNVLGLLDSDQLRNAFDQISPLPYASLSGLGFSNLNSHSSGLRNRFKDLRTQGGRGGHLALYNSHSAESMLGELVAAGSADYNTLLFPKQSNSKQPWGIFASANGTSGRQSALNSDDGVQPGYDFSISGLGFGIDRFITDEIATGIFGGFQDGNSTIDFGQGNTKLKSIQFGVYGAYIRPNGFFLNSYLEGSRDEYDTKRQIPMFGKTATGSPTGIGFDSLVEVGFDKKMGRLTLSPLADVAYSHLLINAFDEEGAGTLNLNVDKQTAESLRSVIGGRISRDFGLGKMVLVPSARVGWQHEFKQDSRPIAAEFGVGGGAFTVNTAVPGKDSAVVGLNAALQITPYTSIEIAYQTELLRTDFRSQSVNATARIKF